MGLLDYFKELAGEVDERDGQINIRTDFANRPGALYLCINKESHRVTSVRLCDIASRLKEDTFESFICEQVKQVKKFPTRSLSSTLCRTSLPFHVSTKRKMTTLSRTSRISSHR